MFGIFSRFLATAKSGGKLDEPPVFPLNELPMLVIELTLDYLSYEDLFSLRRTCKWWKTVIDQRKFKRLILFIDAYPSPKRLFYTNQSVGYSNSLRITDLAALETANFQSTFADLHTLAIFYDPPTVNNLVSHLTIDLNVLDCYRQLEFLSIDMVGFVCGGLWNLEKLKVCHTKARLESNFSLAGCRQLQALAVLEYARPEQASVFRRVTYLYLDSMLELRNFESLQVLCFGLLSTMEKTLDQINSGQLSLPALNEIRMLDWASSYFCRESLLERLQTFETNERTKNVKIFLGDRQIDGVDVLQKTLELVRSFDSRPKYFGAVLNVDYLAFLYRNSGQLSLLFPFVRKLVIEQDLEFPASDRRIEELHFENLEMLVLCSRFADAQELNLQRLESPAPNREESRASDSASSAYSSCNSFVTDERSTDLPPAYRASELFFRFWIKRWSRVRYLVLENYFAQADFDSLTGLLNLKNLILIHCRPDDLAFVARLKNLVILQFKQEHLQRPPHERTKAILNEKEFVFLFKRAPSLRELQLQTKELLFSVLKHDRRHYELSKHELIKVKPVKIIEFHSASQAANYALHKLRRSTYGRHQSGK